MGKLLKPDFKTKVDYVPASQVRRYAKRRCDKLLCIGEDKNGEPYYASSITDGGELLWMIEEFKRKLLNGEFQAD